MTTGMMAELSEAGDTKVEWDRHSADEVAAARAQFELLTKQKKFTAFYVKGPKGEQDRPMTAFDPDAERIILVPQRVGG